MSSGSATGYSTDWYDQILRNAFYQNYNISIAGSSPQDKYAISAGTLNQGTIINDYSRLLAFYNEYSPATFMKIVPLFHCKSNCSKCSGRQITEDVYRAPLVPAIVDGKFGNLNIRNVGNPV